MLPERSQRLAEAEGSPAHAKPGRSSHRLPASRSLLALGAVLGWCTHDLGVFFKGGEPFYVLEKLGPGCLLAAALAAPLGALLAGRRKAQGALITLAALAVWVHDARGGMVKVAHNDLLVNTLCLLAVYALGDLLLGWRNVRGLAASALIGFGLGSAACAARALQMFGLDLAWALPAALPVLGAAALLARVRWAPAVAGATVLASAGWLGQLAEQGAVLERPDLPPPTAAADPEAPNLLLIVLDTARADHFSSYGYERETSPRIDAFAAAHMTRFTEARSTSPFTLSSHGSLLTGLYAGEHGASVGGWASRPLRKDVTTLAQRLREVGYRTAAVAANHLYLDVAHGFEAGFEHFDSRPGTLIRRYVALAQGLGRNVRLGRTYRDAERITDLALDWLERPRSAPYFLFLNYLDIHTPLDPPDDLRDSFSDKSADGDGNAHARRLYDAEILGVDRQLGRLFDALEARPDFDRTVIVLTSDHGESHGEHGLESHCWQLYDALLKVPLFVKPAAARRAPVDETPINGAEVHDLMLTELGLPPPDHTLERPRGLIGEWYPWPLTAANKRLEQRAGTDFSRHAIAWLRDGIKTIVYEDGAVECFDLAADPDELAPLELSEAERLELLDEAASWWAEHPVPTEAVELDEDELKRLEALGYG